MSKALFIGAHPDDVELGCGGTIDKYCKNGFDTRVVVLAEGSSSRHDFYNQNQNLIEQEIKRRKTSCMLSLENLGVNSFVFYDLPCAKLDTIPLLRINKLIENEIKSFNPEIVFTHSLVDTNKDHRIIFESTKIATRPSAFPKIKKIYCYEVLSSTECSFTNVFKPNHFESLTREQLNNKIKSLSFYESEMRDFPNSRSFEGVEILAKFRGMQINKKYAESFEILRSYS